MNRQSWNSTNQNRQAFAGIAYIAMSAMAMPSCLMGKLHSTVDLTVVIKTVQSRADGGGDGG